MPHPLIRNHVVVFDPLFASRGALRRLVFTARGALVIAALALTGLRAQVGPNQAVGIFVSEQVVPTRLVRLNPDTAAMTLVGTTSFVPGLDFRSNGVLYGASSSLSTVSTTTGLAATIGPLPELIISIAFSPADELFALSNSNASLYKIDPRTGQSLSRVTITGTVFTSSGGPFPNEIRGIDFGPDGKLYGIGFGLYSIDPNTGVATRITAAGRAVAPGNTLFSDLDFGPDGQLRAVTASTTDGTSDLYVINPATGIGQLVGSAGIRAAGIATLLETTAAPLITTHPASLAVIPGQSATFSVRATGSPAPVYQWRKDGADVAGATASTLTLTNVSASSAGSYTVVVSNSAGSATSRAATLDVATGSPGRLINLSILTSIARAGDTFTVGTVIGGAGTSGPKPLLVRAVGPSLGQFGVSLTLIDPNLEVFSGPTLVAANNNWGGSAQLSTVFAQVGAFPLVGTSSLDAAAFLPSLAPGNYTVRVSGNFGLTGTVIAEIYDATSATEVSATTPRLINVSVLKDIASGGTLTAGFAIGGSSPVQVLIRAVGPGLAGFGVSAPMADPAITLFDSSTRAIMSNDNWGGGAALSAAFAAVGAFSLGETSRDSAVLATLQPGTYTAQVSGVAGSAGSVLVEVYELSR